MHFVREFLKEPQIPALRVKLPPFRNSSIKKTLIFDLDETLVHCEEEFEPGSVDYVVKIPLPNEEEKKNSNDEEDYAIAGIRVRPGAI